MRSISGMTAGASMAAELVAEYAWSDRTTSSRNSQWRCWAALCDAEGRSVLPATEANFVAYIGWLANVSVRTKDVPDDAMSAAHPCLST